VSLAPPLKDPVETTGLNQFQLQAKQIILLTAIVFGSYIPLVGRSKDQKKTEDPF